MSRWIAAASLAVALLGGAGQADAHTRVFIGGTFGVPIYPVGPYYYSPYYYPYPYAGYSVPPPGWDPGHWEWRQNRWGRRVEVWIPPHLK
jgi:hypothetical protein